MSKIPQLVEKLAKISRGDKLRQAVTADRLNAMQELLMELAGGRNIVAGTGTRISRGGHGIKIRAEGGGRSFGGVEAAKTPWQPFIRNAAPQPSDEEPYPAPQWKVRFNFGVLNNSIPSNQYDPASEAKDTLAEFDVPGGVTFWTVDCVTTGYSIITQSIVANAVQPPPPEAKKGLADTSLKIVIGITYKYTPEGGTEDVVMAKQIRNTHLVATARAVYHEPKAAWAFNEPSFDTWYNWFVTPDDQT